MTSPFYTVPFDQRCEVKMYGKFSSFQCRHPWKNTTEDGVKMCGIHLHADKVKRQNAEKAEKARLDREMTYRRLSIIRDRLDTFSLDVEVLMPDGKLVFTEHSAVTVAELLERLMG